MPDIVVLCPQGTMLTSRLSCGAQPPMNSCHPLASQSLCMVWRSTPGMPMSSSVWAQVPLPSGSCSIMEQTPAFRYQTDGT